MSNDILVVEDDPSILMGLVLNLRKEGYSVRTAADGERGLAELERERPDLVVLDLMLPGIDGLSILRLLREQDPTLPVLVLTALSSETDKVRGLDLGANDYIIKPFSVVELKARIRAALRTADAHRTPTEDVLRAGVIALEAEARRAWVGQRELDLTVTEFDLLRYLMERPERVLTRDQILVGVWGREYEGTARTVDNFVSSLRKKLGDDVASRHLSTVWGVGYRFVI